VKVDSVLDRVVLEEEEEEEVVMAFCFLHEDDDDDEEIHRVLAPRKSACILHAASARTAFFHSICCAYLVA
jgi:formaldehyde-activating enzyme involved in methanogenesis